MLLFHIHLELSTCWHSTARKHFHFQTPPENPSVQTHVVLLHQAPLYSDPKGAIQIRYYYYYHYYAPLLSTKSSHCRDHRKVPKCPDIISANSQLYSYSRGLIMSTMQRFVLWLVVALYDTVWSVDRRRPRRMVVAIMYSLFIVLWVYRVYAVRPAKCNSSKWVNLTRVAVADKSRFHFAF